MKKLVLLCVVLSMWLSGCGNNKNTSGVLTLSEITSTDLSGGMFKIDASATYVPDGGQEPTGAEIDFTADYTTPSNANPFKSKTLKYTLSSTGIAPYIDLIIQGNEPIILRLTASYGGLSQTKIVAIPVVAPLTASPLATSFLITDTAGTPKTVTVTGGNSPYSVSSATPGDIAADISGSTVTITKRASGSTTNTSTTVTITDNKGNKVTVLVGYFK